MGAAITQASKIEASNTYANDLLERLAACQTDGDVVALCKETEKAVMKLQKVNPARFHHVVNLVKLRRADFAQAEREAQMAHDKETKEQMEMWL